MEGLAGLRQLDLDRNGGLTSLPEGLCALAGLEELSLNTCGLRALPEGMEGLAGLRQLNLYNNEGMAVPPVGLGRRMRAAWRGSTSAAAPGCPASTNRKSGRAYPH